MAPGELTAITLKTSAEPVAQTWYEVLLPSTAQLPLAFAAVALVVLAAGLIALMRFSPAQRAGAAMALLAIICRGVYALRGIKIVRAAMKESKQRGVPLASVLLAASTR